MPGQRDWTFQFKRFFHFNNHFDKPGVDRMVYYFVYKAGMWRLTESNPFHLESHYADIKFGEIKNV